MRRHLFRPWAAAALIGLVYLLVAPPTTDLAAQVHRTELARRDVWLVDFSWFGGHHLPSYSVLSPLLGRWLGAALLGALSAVAAAWACECLVRRRWTGMRGAVAAWWFAGGVGALLFTGRVTFILGVAVALLTLVVATDSWRGARTAGGTATDEPNAHGFTGTATDDRNRRRVTGALAAVGALLTALASPVAALFLALVGAAWTLSASDRRSRLVPAVTTAVAFAAALALSVGFPGGGSEPFVASALWPAVVALVVVLVVLPRDERGLRIGVALYLAGVLLAGVLPTPMGGNATRLAALAGGPLLVAALWGRRPVALALLVLPFVYWQLYPPVRDATQAWGDHSAQASYWQPLADRLNARLGDAPARVEVPPTARRGEVRWLSPDVPLARGWVRQLDRHRNPLFYRSPDGPLSVADYRRWLDDNAIGWVALPDAPTDYASRAEITLLRSGRVPGLRRVWSDRHWTLWRVDRARPLASWVVPEGDPHPRIIALSPDRVTFTVPQAGRMIDLRIRWSPYLRIVRGSGCVRRAPNGWTHVIPATPGTVSVGLRVPGPWPRSPSNVCHL